MLIIGSEFRTLGSLAPVTNRPQGRRSYESTPRYTCYTGPPKPAPEGLGALQQPCRVRAGVNLLRGVGPCGLEVSRRLGRDRANRLNQALEGAGRRIR